MAFAHEYSCPARLSFGIMSGKCSCYLAHGKHPPKDLLRGMDDRRIVCPECGWIRELDCDMPSEGDLLDCANDACLATFEVYEVWMEWHGATRTNAERVEREERRDWRMARVNVLMHDYHLTFEDASSQARIEDRLRKPTPD